jgi:type IV pilus assembly protein PilC
VFGVPIALVFLHLWLMTRPGKYRLFVHGLLLRIPLLGAILSQSLTAAFARTFGTLLQAGVPHLDALGIVRDTSSNDVLSDAVETIRRTVREGEAISRPMETTGVFDDLVCNMVDVGEQTGELDRMLLRVAEAYENQVSRRIDAFFKVLEPALLIVMAVFVGFIVMALFLPLMKIMSTLSQP